MNVPLADPPLGGTREHIRSLIPSLIPSEQRVARAFVEEPREVVAMSVSDLAARAETSPATVSRACQNLGFRGFQHLRLLLVRDLGAEDGADEQPAGGPQGGLRGLFDAAARAIQDGAGSVDEQAFAAAAERIAHARRLLIVATGGSAPIAQALALPFISSGRSCEAPTDVVLQRLTASVLTPEDVCIVISESGSNSVTLRAAEAAHAAGAVVIGATSYARAPLSAYTTHLLVAGASYRRSELQYDGPNVVLLLLLVALQQRAIAQVTDREQARAAVINEVFDIVEIREEAEEGAGAGEGSEEELGAD